MNRQLIDYINEQLSQGFTLQTIKRTLLQHYSPEVVDETINLVVEQHVDKLKVHAQELLSQGYSIGQVRQQALEQEHDEIVIDRLVDELDKAVNDGSQKDVHNDNGLEEYVRSQMRAGYSLESIQSLLLNQGHDSEEVHKLMNNFHQNHFYFPKEKIKNIALSFILILFISSIVFFFLGSEEKTRLLDVKIDGLSSAEFIPGTTYDFKIDVINMGSKEAYDVVFSYILEDMKGNMLKYRSDTKAISTTTSFVSSIEIPVGLEEGSYKLAVEADFIDGIAESSLVIDYQTTESVSDDKDVEEGSDIVEEDQDSSQDLDDSSQPEIVQKEDFQGQDPSSDDADDEDGTSEGDGSIDSTGMQLSTSEKIDEAIKDDPQNAQNLCRQLPQDGSQQDCFSKVRDALLEDSDKTCEKALFFMGRQICVSESYDTGENVCSEITDPVERQACYDELKTSSQDNDNPDQDVVPIVTTSGEPPEPVDDYLNTLDEEDN